MSPNSRSSPSLSIYQLDSLVTIIDDRVGLFGRVQVSDEMMLNPAHLLVRRFIRYDIQILVELKWTVAN